MNKQLDQALSHPTIVAAWMLLWQFADERDETIEERDEVQP